jgi:hypothetical protein
MHISFAPFEPHVVFTIERRETIRHIQCRFSSLLSKIGRTRSGLSSDAADGTRVVRAEVRCLRCTHARRIRRIIRSRLSNKDASIHLSVILENLSVGVARILRGVGHSDLDRSRELICETACLATGIIEERRRRGAVANIGSNTGWSAGAIEGFVEFSCRIERIGAVVNIPGASICRVEKSKIRKKKGRERKEASGWRLHNC